MSALIVWAISILTILVTLVICLALIEEWKNPK
jgi:hypothetical protein